MQLFELFTTFRLDSFIIPASYDDDDDEEDDYTTVFIHTSTDYSSSVYSPASLLLSSVFTHTLKTLHTPFTGSYTGTDDLLLYRYKTQFHIGYTHTHKTTHFCLISSRKKKKRNCSNGFFFSFFYLEFITSVKLNARVSVLSEWNNIQSSQFDFQMQLYTDSPFLNERETVKATQIRVDCRLSSPIWTMNIFFIPIQSHKKKEKETTRAVLLHHSLFF